MNELTTQSESGNIKGLIESDRFKLAVSAALPTHLKPERFIRVALTALTRTPKLAQCEQASFFQCLLTLSQFGLEPDGRNAHLIPFENRKRGVTECQVIIDYKGLVDLAMRSGKVAYIHADKVCANDRFEYDRGAIKTHLINFKEPRGDAYAYYAICRFKDETEKCEVMTKDEIEKIRARSRAGQSGPWQTDFDEMAKKTVFRRLSKWLQLSPEYRDALEIDADSLEEHRFNAALPAIARPVIGGPSGNGHEEKPTPRRGRKQKPEPLGPNGTEIEKRLKDVGYSTKDLLVIAIKNKWVDPPQGFSGNADELEQVPLASVGEEKLGTFLENWAEVATQIDALKSEPIDPLFA
jgi:recombination protein RecT